MKEVIFHGRGGQGAVAGADILADAAMREGKYSQSFPTFGPERRGAPVMAFTRIDDKPIRVRCQIYEPDYVIVLDSTIGQFQNLTAGLKPDGSVIINTPLTAEKVLEEKIVAKGKIYPIDASSIAMKIIGSPVLNTVILGAFSAATGEVKLKSLCEAVSSRFSETVAQKNNAAMEEAYNVVKGRRN
jgi:2-oxoacid:acceptor oxidoreductase gamma subunit (pyruvate/2-ketoisovalerate family)